MSKHIQPISHYLPHERVKNISDKKRSATFFHVSHENFEKGCFAAQVTIGQCQKIDILGPAVIQY